MRSSTAVTAGSTAGAGAATSAAGGSAWRSSDTAAQAKAATIIATKTRFIRIRGEGHPRVTRNLPCYRAVTSCVT